MRVCCFGLAMMVSGALSAGPLGEIGVNDFRISFRGGNGDPAFDGVFPAVAYNAAANEYLVVYLGDFRGASCPMDSPIEREIFRQRIDAETGALLGSGLLPISSSGPACDDTHGPSDTAVAYNATSDEYLVVWSGDDEGLGLVDEGFEIFGQRLDGDGLPIGSDDFRISFMTGGSSDFSAFSPRVVWNAVDNEYLVVWSGDTNTGGLVNDEFEIFGQRLNANGTPQGPAGHIRISQAGGTGGASAASIAPAVVHNATANQYLIVWHADPGTGGLVDGEFEIFGQRLDALGTEIGTNDFRISDMGGTGDPTFDGVRPDVTWNAAANEYLVVWDGDDNQAGLIAGDSEIFGQRLNASGAPIGANDFRISDMGGTGANLFFGLGAAVTWSAAANEYLVVWEGADDIGGQVANEREIFSQRITALGGQIAPNDFRISDMAGLGNPNFTASDPAVSWNPTNDEYLVVWHGDQNEGDVVDNEFEIYGQRLGDPTIFADGFE